MLTAIVVPLASTAYDVGQAAGYVIVPLIIGLIILVIARRQDRSKGSATTTASMQNPFAGASTPAPTATPAPAQTAPPGWYDDPWRQARLRYWDGTAWSGHTAP